ncbi:hypothetical protein M9458_017474, partial [Cirrhinus mrigala]
MVQVNQEKIASKSVLVLYISQYVDHNEAIELEDKGMAELLSLLDIIEGMPVVCANIKRKE